MFLSSSSLEQTLQMNGIYRCTNSKCTNENRTTVRVRDEKLGFSTTPTNYSIVDEGGKVLHRFYCPDFREHVRQSVLFNDFCLPKESCLKSRKTAVNEISKIGLKKILVSPVGANPKLRHTGYDGYILGNKFPPGYSVNHPPPDTYKSTYGDVRTNEKNGVLTVRPHNGWDFYAPMCSAVYAMADGFVTSTVDDPAPREGKARGDKAGWRVRLQFTYENTIWRAVYCHLDSVCVSGGQCVAAGAVLGTVGDTGNADKDHPHLHLTVYKGSKEINPEELFGRWQWYMSPNDKTLLLPTPFPPPTITPIPPTMQRMADTPVRAMPPTEMPPVSS